MILLLLVAGLTGSCSRDPAPRTELTGAGSTFVYPLMAKWATEYEKGHPDFHVDYQSIGSGGGIRVIEEGRVDFGATDAPVSDELLAESKNGKLLHIPVAMGADVPAYNLPGVLARVKFTPAALAGIFLGKVTKWNDPQIAIANPEVKLPNLSIVVIHRDDVSGSTYIWTDYLSKVSPEWKSHIGANTEVDWPVGLGAKGNDGVAGLLHRSAGGIGYVELDYAERYHIAFGCVQNAAGTFVKASSETVGAAADDAQIPDDFRYSITNAAGKNAYPISGTTWLLIPIRPRDPSRNKMVVDFANWILGEGQELAPTLHYAKIPTDIAARAREALQQVR